MPVITVSGSLGSGARELGRLVADDLGIDYVDQTLLVDAAQQLGVPVERVAGRDERTLSFGERIGGVLRSFLERSATMGATDPLLGASGLEVMLARSYEEEAESSEPDVSDRKYVKVLTAVIQGLADKGDVVIVGRGSHVVLRDKPGALHVNVVAPKDYRVSFLVRRDNIAVEEAGRRIDRHDPGRISYHRKLFGVHPNDPTTYHLTLNPARMSQPGMAKTVLAALESIRAAAT